MLVQSILRKIDPIKGFVFERAYWGKKSETLSLEITVRARKGTRPICSGCGKPAPGYDTLTERRFLYPPLWGIMVCLVYAMRRVKCPRCGVKVEAVPWADGKHPVTRTYQWYLARWAQVLSWQAAAETLNTSWHYVFCSVQMAVEWGRAHMSLEGITAIGVDEMAWACGHRYITAVYQINEGFKRLLWVGEHRRVKTLLRFFRWLGKERCASVQFVCSDLWEPYMKVIQKKIGHALHILDRFHLVSHANRAVDEVRRQEAAELRHKGCEPVLTRSRWCLLKRLGNLSASQACRLRDLVRLNLKTVRAYLLKESLAFFWDYVSPYWAGRFLDEWCSKAMRSRLQPMKRVAKMYRAHRGLILNWFRAKKAFSSGVVEGLNNKAKVAMRNSYGFSTFKCLEIALYHKLGKLPEPKLTHRFF
jgi:transposase